MTVYTVFMMKEQKILLVNTESDQDGPIAASFRILAERFTDSGMDTELLWLGEKEIQKCTACGKCNRIRRCVTDDIVNTVADAGASYSALIIGSPVYYGEISVQAAAFLDRLFRSASPSFAGKTGACVLSGRGKNVLSAAKAVYERFAMADMYIVSSAGRTENEDMVLLADRVSWLLKCMEHGKSDGIFPPEYCPAKITDFVR